MLEPKIFYRELDTVLAKISKQKHGKNFLLSIVSELKKEFGQTLHIQDVHIYERRGDDFVYIKSSSDHAPEYIQKKLPLSSMVIRLAIKHGSFIYDSGNLAEAFLPTLKDEYIIPAAISICSTEKQWLFVFEIGSGWVREEVTLFLNAVRTALNYRLFSETITSELKKAEQIQKSLLPRQAPTVTGFDIYGDSHPAELVGGDFYDYFQFNDEDNFGISIGDASGHGLPAALLVRDVVIGLRMGLAKEMRIIHTVRKLNQVIQRSTYPTSFVSLFVGEVEYDGHFFYVNAGHPAPLLFVRGVKDVVSLDATGIALGFLPEIFLHRGYTHLPEDSVLVLYSDGIIERQNTRGELFGTERLKEIVLKNFDRTARELNEIIFKRVFDFGNRTHWEDDATLVVIKRIKNNP